MENIKGVEDTVVVPGGRRKEGKERGRERQRERVAQHNKDYCYRVQERR